MGDPGDAQLFRLAVQGVQEIPARIGVGVRAAPGDTRPFRIRARPEQAQIKRTPPRRLKVVDPPEAPPAQAPAQVQPFAHVERPGAVVGPHGVEISRGGGEVGIRPGGEKGDMGAFGFAVTAADGGERPHGLDEIAKRPQLDHQDPGARPLGHQDAAFRCRTSL